MDSVFFFASKLLWLALSPSSLLVIWIVTTTLLLHFKRQKLALRLLWALSLVVILIGFLPLGQWMLMPLEKRFTVNPTLPDKVDGIMVLAGADVPKTTRHWQQVQLNGGAERNLTFIQLAKRYPEAKLVFTGGGSSLVNQELKEADIAKQLYQQLGFDTSRIKFERNARNTAENAVLSYVMIKPQPDETWVLITTAWHMPRSIGIFCHIGWSMTPYPVDFYTADIDASSFRWQFSHNLNQINLASKEWIGLLVYYLTNRTPEIFPRGCETE